MKIFGIQVAGSYSSEAHVFAQLLANRPADMRAAVLMHAESGDQSAFKRFGDLASCEMIPFDTGWRLNSTGKTRSPDRLLIAARYLLSIPEAVRIAKTHGPEIIYSNQQHYDCRLATAIARKLDKPQVMHLHYVVGPWLKQSVLSRLLSCEHVIAVSDFIRQDAIKYGVSPERVTTIRNSITAYPILPQNVRSSLRAELGLPDDAFVICMVSRIDPGKGHSDVLKAFERVAALRQQARLVIIGTGTIDSQIHEEAKSSTAAEKMLFLGRRTDVPQLLGVADIFIHPSRRDPCPLAVLEAQGAGLPVVAYSEGGVVEIVKDSVTGFLTRVEDIQALATSILKLSDSPTLLYDMGQAARQNIELHFSPKDSGELFGKVMQSLI